MRKKKERIPTCYQAQTLKSLMEGSELVVGQWYTGEERIFWKVRIPGLKSPLNPEGIEKIDCGYPKLKRYRMSHMERYGWVVRTENGWEITDDGKKAWQKYEDYIKEVNQRLGRTPHAV